METIGDRIATLMTNKKLSQKELTQKAGITESALSRYLKNERQPKVEILAQIATALNTTTDYLIFGNKFEMDYNDLCRLLASVVRGMSYNERMKLIQLIIET